MLNGLDHVVVAVRELAAASQRTSALLGCEPWWRGSHPGAGTANALYRLDNTSLELLAPQGEGALGGLVAQHLQERGEGLLALAFATDDADVCAQRLRSAGLVASEPRPGEGREVAGGALRRWRNVLLAPDSTRGLWLFAIERARAASDREPSAAAPADSAVVAALDHVVVLSPALEASRALYGAALGLRLALDRRFERRGLRILFFRSGGVTVEVVGRLDAEPDAQAPDRFGGLAWRVGDAEAARQRLCASGFDVSPLRPGAKPGTRVFTVRDATCGVPTLMLEPAP